MTRAPFKLKSGNTTPFKQMGSSPMEKEAYNASFKQGSADHKKYLEAHAKRRASHDKYLDANRESFIKVEGKWKHKESGKTVKEELNKPSPATNKGSHTHTDEANTKHPKKYTQGEVPSKEEIRKRANDKTVVKDADYYSWKEGRTPA